MRGAAEWKPKLRWLIRRMRLLRPSRRPLVRPRRIAARMPGRWRRIVCASLMNGVSREREAWVVELVEQPELFLEQEGTVERLVGLLDLAEQRELVDRLLGGRLEQRPAGALDPAAAWGVRTLVGVPFVAADLVDGALGEPHDVERVEGDLGGRERLADRLLIAAAHVDGDRPDRLLALAELVEERP